MLSFMPKTFLQRLRVSLVGLIALAALVGAAGTLLAGLLSEGEAVRGSLRKTAESSASMIAVWRSEQHGKAVLVASYIGAAIGAGQGAPASRSGLLDNVAAALPEGTGALVRDADDRVVHRRLSRGAQGAYRWDITVPIASSGAGWRRLTLRIPTDGLTDVLTAAAGGSDAPGVRVSLLDVSVSPPAFVAGDVPPQGPAPSPGVSERTDSDGVERLYCVAAVEPASAEPVEGAVTAAAENWVVEVSVPTSEAYRRELWLHVAGALGILASILIGLALLPLVIRRLGSACREISAGMEAVVSGDYTHRVQFGGKDELGRICTLTNTILETLDASTNEIESDVQALTTSSMAILAASEQQQAAATTQSTSLQETVSTVEELDLSARQAAENAQQVVLRTEEASQQILELSEKAQRINKVSEFIDQISRQIRVLALNASIEASQVSETTSGFSVIASEIHRLAEDTRKSTTEIEELVQDMQDSTNTSVMTMEQMVESVKVIGMAMNQQSVATGQISEAMTDMSRSMAQALESTQSTVQQSDEINALARSLEAATGRLRQMGASAEVSQAAEQV